MPRSNGLPIAAKRDGCEIIDLDGRQYLDMSTMGIGACLLGYGDPDVTEAVVHRVRAGCDVHAQPSGRG
jgi:glutamate-1-semialdehyde aminotransferase